MRILVGANENSHTAESDRNNKLLQILKILSSTILNILSWLYLHILSFSNPQIFVFLIFTFVRICQNEVLIEERQLMKSVGIFPIQKNVFLIQFFFHTDHVETSLPTLREFKRIN